MVKDINLINKDKSDIKYELFTFPDDEPHIKFTDDIDRKSEYRVISRVSSPNELYIVLQVGSILKRCGLVYELYIEYLMSMRMDRVINFNEAFSLEIVANMINSISPDKVYIFEAHSERTFKLINNSYPLETYMFDENSDIVKYEGTLSVSQDNVICFPDNGAYERYKNRLSDITNYIVMNKVRDLDNKGVIKSMEISMEHITNKNFKSITIVDDLCDGGGTFCWGVNILKEKYGGNSKDYNIYVKHMVNPGGLQKLVDNFDHVYITNSYKDWNNDNFAVRYKDKLTVFDVV